MIENYKFTIFILLVMFETCIDPDVRLCKSNEGKLLLLLHHFLSVFILGGSLILDMPRVHLFVMGTVMLVWFKYKRCITTIYNNKLCYFDDNYQFKNYFYHFRNCLKYDNKFLLWDFLLKIFILALYDIYLICNYSNANSITTSILDFVKDKPELIRGKNEIIETYGNY